MEKEKTYFESALSNYIDSKGVNSCYYLSSDNINYLTLFNFLFNDSILCNNIANVDCDFLLNNEFHYCDNVEEYDEDYNEYYQYYIVDVDAWRLEKYKEYLKECKKESNIDLFYSDVLECYVVGISHFGTSWGCVPTNIKIIRED